MNVYADVDVLVGELDLSGCAELTAVTLSCALVNSAIVSGCPNLLSFRVAGSGLESFDVSDCPLLNYIEVGGGNFQMPNIDASNIPLLDHFVYSAGLNQTPLETVNLENCPQLEYLELCGTNIESIDINEWPLLETLNIMPTVFWSEYYEEYDYTSTQPLRFLETKGHQNIKLMYLACTQIETLDVRGCSNLIAINGQENGCLEAILFENNYAMYNICNDLSNREGPMAAVDLTNINAAPVEEGKDYVSITLTNCQLADIDLTPVKTHLRSLNLKYNSKLKTIDVTDCERLEWVYLTGTRVDYLDFSDCPLINYIILGEVENYIAFNSFGMGATNTSVTAIGDGAISAYYYYGYNEQWQLINYPLTFQAIPDAGADFEGWYTVDGELYSAETELIFEDGVSDLLLEARFTDSSVTLGDSNGDGEVTSADALLVIRYALELLNETELELAVSDYNGDGNVDVTDALLILRCSMIGNA